MKKGASELVKLKHPSVLAVTHPLAESKDSLAFATEPVFASLANVLGHRDNIDRVSPALREFDLLDIEVLSGMIHLSSACHFLHQVSTLCALQKAQFLHLIAEIRLMCRPIRNYWV